MAGPFDFTGQNIENTYQRVLQTPDGTTFYDGTGSLVTLPSANTASLLTTASVSSNTITFTKGDGSTFPITVNTGSGGGSPTNTGSLLVTASANLNQITFTKGDASQFTIIVDTGSATPVDTGSFVTTSSFNSFTSSYNSGSFTGSFTGIFNGTASWAYSASQAISSSYVLSSSYALSSSYSTTASYALNGGVTQIIAGTNITISPTNGLGDVTINSSGGGGDVTNLKSGSFGVTVDGQGSTITTGDAGYILIPYNCTMSGWYIFGDQVGSIGIDLRKDTYDTFPAVQGDSICNSFFPTMSSAQKSSGSVVGWTTTTLNSGDIINFNVTSSLTLTRANLIINVIKS